MVVVVVVVVVVVAAAAVNMPLDGLRTQEEREHAEAWREKPRLSLEEAKERGGLGV